MAAEPNTDALYTHASKATEHLEQLATGLGQIGADPAAVKAVSQMAGVTRKISRGLAKGGTAEPEAEQPATMDAAADQMMAERRAGPQS